MKFMPSYLIQAIFHLTNFIAYTLGVDFAPLKVKKHFLGSGVLTNVSKLDVEHVFAPHIDFGNTNLLMVITTPKDKAVVVDGKIVKRKMININLTFDQRMGSHYEVLESVKRATEVWNNPSLFC